MRIFFSILLAALVGVGCYLLDHKNPLPLAMGRFLSPQEGFWQNAEPVNENYSASLSFPELQGESTVYFDDRLVPHVFTANETDAYFIQGYLHARFRLWQMEFQVLAAAGRVSEVIGDIAVNHDREFRRLGMVYAAEQSLKAMEANDTTRKACDAYTAGVNAYIHSLTRSNLPLEYKLLGYRPENWTNLKTALFLKYMSYDLAAHELDFERTNARNFFSKADYDLLFPAVQDSLDPIIPKGTIYSAPSIVPVKPASADSLYFTYHQPDSVNVSEAEKPDRDNGSNNWAVAGSKTKSGAPILCNDPHLGLNLPSLWYEIQLSTPGFNAYGVSFPGAPGVIIGFNDSCAFGFTNGGRDVRDYYEIRFKDEKRTEYWFNGQWMPTTFRYEQIKVAGKPTVVDTVAYTVLGPVMYDASFTGNRATNQKNYAVHWSAHNPSNELMLFSILNRARNYADYLEATKYLETPGQNCVFACKNGDIALRTQGRFPAKWKGQGDFVMPGTDSSYLWQGYIPNAEVPYQYNPERGFVSSANQEPADTTYPYYLGSDYPTYRGFIINRLLNKMQQVTPVQMMRMQCSNYNVFAEMALPIFTKHMLTNQLTEEEQGYFSTLASWNKINDVNEKGATIFAETWKAFMDTVYYDEFAAAPPNTARPYESTLLEAVLKDSTYKFIDDIRTPGVDSLNSIVTIAFKKAVTRLREANQENRLPWGKYKDTHVNHLLRLPAFSRLHLPIGGGTHIINATKEGHGPSWRMVISLTKETEAYGVYPGGQNGNPGSKYYDQFVDHWVKGEYYSLWMMKASETSDKRIIGKLHFSKS